MFERDTVFHTTRCQKWRCGRNAFSDTVQKIDYRIDVGDIIRQEDWGRIEGHFEVFVKWTRELQHIEPELVICEGEPVPEIRAQIKYDPTIDTLALGAGEESKGLASLITHLSKSACNLESRSTIVPGDMSKKYIGAIT